MTNTSQINIDVAGLLKLLSDIQKTQISQYNGSKLQLNLLSDIAEGKSILDKVFDEVNTLVGNTVEVKLSSSKIKDTQIFYQIDDFLQKYERLKDNFDTQTIIILENDGRYLLKNPREDFTENNKVIHNIHEYKRVLSFFLNTPDFTPYISATENQFTLISKTHGVFNIGYKLPDIAYFQGLNLHNVFSRFEEEFKKKEFVQFFKEIVIAGVHNAAEEDRFNEIIKENNALLNLAKRDYETYVSNFAFDKIKSEFKEEREKYFETIDKNIGSIGKQVISFPLTFGATIFASYKVKDQPEFLVLILVAYFLYTIIAFLVLNMTAYNVKCLRKDVDQEEKTIRDSYGVIYEGFKSDFKKIRNKIVNLRVIIGVLYFVLIALLILFLAFTFHYLGIVDLSVILNETKT
ncbi:hypothetical protein [Robiginitalea biformata]|uniref:hypothetical protein n=1 Tax=Robiginitalea biformata TaxID=252307 RepID=UPI001000A5DA|nr:MAG: hypothetical protein DSY77_14665 [Bacteroidota bacterium]